MWLDLGYPDIPIVPPWSLYPDGTVIHVNWESFSIGASVFIPAINLPVLISQMRKAAKLKGVELIHVERIEGGKLGIRFWRIR